MTGASSGIGLQCVLALLNANASVFGIDISPEPQDLAKYSKFHFHQINLTNPTAAFEAIAVCHEVFGPRIDILQNIAGVMDTYNSADTVSDTMLDRVLNINLVAPIKLMRAVLPTMKEQGSGSIINVASAAGTSGIFAGVAYTASKHGIVSSLDIPLLNVRLFHTTTAKRNRLEQVRMWHGDSRKKALDAML